MITLKVAGFAELEKALRTLPEEIAGKVLTSALRKAGTPMVETAKRLAPRSAHPSRIGHMADSIKLRAFKQPSDQDLDVGFWLGPDAAHFYGLFQEFGTVRMPAHPFLRPAWDSQKEATLTRFGQELGAEIERAAKRLAK